MRPLELHIKHFRSFSGESTFDFRGRNLVGIVGPIGSGKSSVLDAISYALYARTPRIAGAVRDLIHQRSDTAVVRLTFVVGDGTWQVTRSIRKSQSNHTLHRLDNETGEIAETVTQKGEVNDKVERLIGLDFDGFSRSVLLAQGKFAEFLTAQPAQRDRVLKGVFGHERIDGMRQAAKQRAGEMALQIEKLSGRLEGLAIAGQRLLEQRADLSTMSESLEALLKVQPRVADHDERLAAIGARLVEVDKRSSALTARSAQLPDTAFVTGIVEEAGRARMRRTELAAMLGAHKTAVGVAEAELAKSSVDISVIDRATALLSEHNGASNRLQERKTRLAAAAKAVDQLDAEAKMAGDALETATRLSNEVAASLEATSDAATTARETLERERHANMAHTLRSGLTSGELCPVCAQHVVRLPTLETSGDVVVAESLAVTATADLDTVRRSAEKTRSAVATRTQQLYDLDARLGLAAAEHESATKAADEARHEIAALERDLTRLLGEGDPVDLVRHRRDVLSDARDAAETARQVLERSRSEHDQSIRSEQSAGKQLTEMRVTAARVASALDLVFEPADASGGDDASGALDVALAELRATIATETGDLVGEAESLVQEQTVTVQARREILETVGVERDINAEITALGASVDTVAGQIEAIEKDLAGAEKARRQLGDLEERRGHFDRIAADLTDARFVRFLLDDERVRLADLASEHFQQLSSGRYRFSDDGKFNIIDLTTADGVRKADSLSGGETFLASLALALGLAEMVARCGGRLEAFFLDEGFGTLDPEHLNLAMEGIERLVTDHPERLVVVVSHVPELRLRVEDLIELDRHPLTGDTVVLRA